MSKKNLFCVFCFIVTLVLSNGVNASGSKDSSTSSESVQKPTVTMMVINSFTKTADAPLYLAAAEYSKTGSANIVIEAVPSTNIKDKFTTAALSGSGPDIVSLDNAGWTADLAAMGLLMPIDDKIGSLRNEFIDDALKTNIFQGKCYGVPWYINNMVMYYNKTLFARAGIAGPPTNWTELQEAVRKLTAIGKYGLNFPIGSPGGYTIAAFLLQNGNQIIDTSSAEPKVVFNSLSGVEALTYVTDLYIKYKGMPESVKSTLSWDQLFAPFIQEDVGIVFSGDWAIAPFAAGNPNLNYGIAPLPTGKNAATILGGYNLAINKNSKNIDQAWDFIRWLSQRERSRLLAQYSRIHARKDVVNSELVKEQPVYEIFVQETVHSRSRPNVTQWQQIQTWLGEAFTAVILGEAKPQDALNKYAKQSEELLKNK